MSANVLSPEFLNAAMHAPSERLQAYTHYLLTGDPPPTPDGPLLLTVSDAATLLGVSRSTVWRAIRRGRLRKISLYEGCERLRRADVEALAGGAS